MKKIWATLGLAGILASSAAVGVLDLNQQENVSTKLVNQNHNDPINSYATIYDWTDVNINHQVETKATGTNTVVNTAYANKASSQSWSDFFANSKLLVISGAFDLHTYTNPKTLSTITASINEAKSSKFEKVWEATETNDNWKGTGHHTATITLTITAKYDEKEATTLLSISSYVYARTAGAFHSCWTSSQVNVIRFIVDYVY